MARELEFYYDERDSSYWLKKFREPKFTIQSDRNLKLWMRANGIPVDKEDEKTGLKYGDKLLLQCQEFRGVDYAGPLAGWPAGLHKIGPRSILVTSQVAQVKAEKGKIDNWEKFLAELLGNFAEYLLYWLKVAREALVEGDFRPGQMIGLFGESSCGKSVLQTLITAFLGGRVALPFRYMTGKTPFNADLAQAEHWMIGDEKSSVRLDRRREFGQQIKDGTVNPELSVHAKGREAFTAPTFRRITLSGNHEAENMMIMPPLDPSILDKVMLFRCSKADLGSSKNFKRRKQQFLNELPALAWELDNLKIPARYHDARYGVKAHHDEELLQVLMDISPEKHLLELIDQVLWQRNKEDEWDGSAMDLEQHLRNSPFNFAVENLLTFPSAAGTYLARLAQKMPHRITKRTNAGKTYWHIKKERESRVP